MSYKTVHGVQDMLIKCCLLSIPDEVVDVIDDEDVELLLEEVSLNLSRAHLARVAFAVLESHLSHDDFTAEILMRAVETVLLQ